MIFPLLSSQRLTLTPINYEDRDAIFALFSDQQVTQYYDLEPLTQISQADKLIALFNTRYKNGEGIRWAIRLKSTDELMGTCGFNSWSVLMKYAFIGYDLKSLYWGKGYAFEAIHMIIKAAFDGLLRCGALNRIQADTVLGNKSSEALLLKLGFFEEGLRRQSGFWKNRFHDLKCFGLLKSDFNK
ncbi:GNAT family N-acetyltransferase [Pseudoalteromonas sp. MMG006]|uniref:GNAT family N-acetyltransferase n=1 Tax=Pseudoalteromonas sp. MMG006 TaxID=2822683 RepID=UPI001B376B36|nr:GNAT family protein [Pseudoalteromonas sp. MMG006]MBQ4798742.1 GNAT family N-acetyltransferase [Pseudoalteromonas sp. MMG006]